MIAALDAFDHQPGAAENWANALPAVPATMGNDMRAEPMKEPRRAGKHVGAALDMLAQLGCREVEVIKRTHLRVSWAWGPRRLAIVMPCTPRCTDNAAERARQDIRRAIRDAAGGRR